VSVCFLGASVCAHSCCLCVFVCLHLSLVITEYCNVFPLLDVCSEKLSLWWKEKCRGLLYPFYAKMVVFSSSVDDASCAAMLGIL